MRLAKAFGMAGLTVAAVAGVASATTLEPFSGIIGDDDRKPLSKPEAYWSAVGKIEIAGFSWLSSCTGTLVAPNVVITAAHCLVDRRMRKNIAAARVHFRAGLSRDKSVGHATGRCVAFLGDVPLLAAKAKAEAFLRDAAAIVLDKPLKIAPLPLSGGAAVGDAALHAGYGRDRRYMLSVHRGCRVLDRSGPLYITDCDSNFGQSGGPVLIEDDGAPKLAGIMVSVGEAGNVMLGVEAWRELVKAPECAAP
jgi:protease YdgD